MNNEKIIVSEEYAKDRLDIFLSDYLEKLSRSSIQKLIKKGYIIVNGKETKANYILKEGDVVDVEFEKEEVIEILPENIEIEIVYEDNDIAIVNKPQGMVVHPAAGNFSGTLVNALLYHLDSLSDLNGNLRPGIVHRIDKETSGLLMIAKNNFAHERLASQLKAHTTNRLYEALVEGIIKEDRGKIDAPIGRHLTERKKMTVTETNSKEAVTHFSVLERYKNHTLIEAKLETGRTHQIRVHMKYINHPVVGDKVYGFKAQKFKLNGQLLHAKKIGFIHPRTEEYIEFNSELPEYFKDILRKVKEQGLY
jgi:23S rRNA pseudouridine1911/1915/1917 synthase